MGKTILITGVTGAIGSATAMNVAKADTTVILLARNKSKLEVLKNKIIEKTGNKNVDILVADLSQMASVKNAANEFKQKYNRLDALINIAAVYRPARELTKDNLETMFAVNHLAPFALTNELLPLLKASQPSRVINVAAPSFTKLNFDDLQGEKKFSPVNAFGASNMMNLLFTYELARRVETTDVSISAFHPGLVKSEITSEMPLGFKLLFSVLSGKADKPAATLAKMAVDPAYQNINGKFIKFDGKETKSNAYSHDKANQEKLWKISEQLVG